MITAISQKRHCELIAPATPIGGARKLNSTDVIEALADLFGCCQVNSGYNPAEKSEQNNSTVCDLKFSQYRICLT